MEEIVSKNNPKLAAAQKLLQKKYRKAEGKFLVEGAIGVRDMATVVSYECVFLAASFVQTEECAELIKCIDCPVYSLSDNLFGSLCETVTPSGAVAVARIPVYSDLRPTSTRILVLDGVHDAGNMGTLIRSAVAFGYSEVYAIDCVDIYCGKVVRSTMSGLCKVRTIVTTAVELGKLLQGYTIVALDMQGCDISTVAAEGNIAVVVGGEAHGVTDAVKSLATTVAAIPMQGAIESLNAAVAGGIAMYVLSRR